RGVVRLVGALDALGEGAEVLVLGPLVVGRAQRDADVDVLDDDGGLVAGGTLALALAAAQALQRALHLVLGTRGTQFDGAAQRALALGQFAAAVGGELGEARAVALGDVVELVRGLAELVAEAARS